MQTSFRIASNNQITKIKLYDDGNDAKIQIINEVRKLHKTQSSPRKPSQQKTYNIQRNTLLFKNTSAVMHLVKNTQMLLISVSGGTATKPPSHTGSNLPSYSANTDEQMQNSHSVTHAMVVHSHQKYKSCSESK